jgi:hypothetical protein
MEMTRTGELDGWEWQHSSDASCGRSVSSTRFTHQGGSFADRAILSQHTAVIRLTKTKHTAPSRKTHSWILAPADHRPPDIL